MQGCVPCRVLLFVVLSTSLVSGFNPFFIEDFGGTPLVGTRTFMQCDGRDMRLVLVGLRELGCSQAELVGDESVVDEGETPPEIVIERVISFAEEGSDLVVLRNIGGQTQDLTGWKLDDSERNKSSAYDFGRKDCVKFGNLAPSQKLELKPATEEEPCGFSFNINFRYHGVFKASPFC